MKLSLSWIFDHITGVSWKDLDVPDLLKKFNDTTAEIDNHTKIEYNLSEYALAQAISRDNDAIELFVPEWNKDIKLIGRTDYAQGNFYLVKRENKKYRYALLNDFYASKEGLMGALSCSPEMVKGAWKERCVNQDYLIVIDNKSLSHRPDLWGHRGIAREMAALLGVQLVPEEQFLNPCIIRNYASKSSKTSENPVELAIENPKICSRLAGIYIKDIFVQASLPWVAQRLALIDAKPINAVVDATNFVMYDIGHPMHAFDAKAFITGALTARNAQDGKSLKLLDGTTIALASQDCVIADGDQPVSLAGIMGGFDTGVTVVTRSVIAEAAHFDPVTIRKSSAAHKKRTEASIRFEKNLDPNQNTTALMRFLNLLDSWDISYTTSGQIASVGLPVAELVITFTQEFLTKRIGISVNEKKVIEILKRLGFGVQISESDKVVYTVTVPTFRRDCTIKEDILEEIVRFIGYAHIPAHVPLRPVRPVDNHDVLRLRNIKNYCAFGLRMHELINYNLYDENWLAAINFKPSNSIQLANPVSELWQNLVTSLVPHMLKAVNVNDMIHEQIRFFEWGKTWLKTESNAMPVAENNVLSLIWYDPIQTVDFYKIKSQLCGLFQMIKVPIMWQTPSGLLGPWYHPYQTAQLVYGDHVIGYAGKASPVFFKNVARGDAFIAEINGEFLLSYESSLANYKPLIKYPKVYNDISFWMPQKISIGEIEHAIALIDARIIDIYLLDYFQKPEYPNKHSVTMRYVIADEHKTLTKEEIDEISRNIRTSIESLGATLR